MANQQELAARLLVVMAEDEGIATGEITVADLAYAVQAAGCCLVETDTDVTPASNS
jgi:hypothetical protein